MTQVCATSHVVDLSDGREVEVGEVVDVDLSAPHNEALLAAGLLVRVGPPAGQQAPADEVTERPAEAPAPSETADDAPHRARRASR